MEDAKAEGVARLPICNLPRALAAPLAFHINGANSAGEREFVLGNDFSSLVTSFIPSPGTARNARSGNAEGAIIK